MAIWVEGKKRDNSPAPEGLWQGVCCDVVDKGEQPTPWGPKRQISLYWQLDQIDEKTGKRFYVSEKYTASLSEKANLRKALQAWRGKKFTEEEAKRFDVEKLLGVNCLLSIAHDIKEEGDVWAKVQAILPLPKGQAKIAVQDFLRKKDRDTTNGHGFNPDAEDPNETAF